MMPKMNLSQYQFTLRDPYQEGDRMSELEANILNYHRSDLIRKIATKWMAEVEREAPDGVLTIPQLDKLTNIIAQLDAQYSPSEREEPKLPAFNHQLRLIAINEVTQLGPSHLIPDFERRVELAMRDPENRQKARRQLVASLRSIFAFEEEDD